MPAIRISSHFILSLCLVLLVTAYRIYVLQHSSWNLFFDEAQYWDWSKSLDMGYYSKPPMVAWMIYATTNFCGDAEWCIRLSSPIIYALTSMIIYAIAAHLSDPRVAFYSCITFLTLPAVSLSSSLVSTDPSLLLFWSLTLWLLLKALDTDQWVWWLLCGIAAGLGMLTKYNMLLFLVSSLLFFYVSKPHRIQFRNLKFWISAVLAFVVFLPNIIWNAKHGFVSFLHTKDNAHLASDLFHVNELLAFVGGQFGVFGPILFSVLIWIFMFHKPYNKDPQRMLIAYILPLFGLITLISFLSRAHANWAAPIYITATILVVHYLIHEKKKALLYASIIIHLLLYGIYTHFDDIVAKSPITLTGSRTNVVDLEFKDPFKRLRGWKELGNSIALLREHYPNATLLSDSRKIHAELLYYAKAHTKDMVKWNPDGSIKDHYDLTTNILSSTSDDFILVTQAPSIDHIQPYFNDNWRVGYVKLSPYEDSRHDHVYFYYLEGFKGYE